MPTADEIRKELTDKFKGFTVNGKPIDYDKKYFEAYVEIQLFLSDPKRVLEACAALDRDMTAILAGRYDNKENNNSVSDIKTYGEKARKYFEERKKAFKEFFDSIPKNPSAENPPKPKPYPEGDSHFSGLLDAALATEEKKAGFDQVLQVWGALESQPFLDGLVRRKHPFKDYGAKPDHGAYAHRIQWYAISKKLFDSKPPVAEVYASIADWNVKDEIILWDALSDRAENTTFSPVEKAHDFRCPNDLNIYLLTNIDDFPVLGSFLSLRQFKRMGSLTSLALDWQGAAALKLFKNLFRCLSPKQKSKVEELIYNEKKVIYSEEEFLEFAKSCKA
ncbi:MAG TPA: LirA/MavJ family T4SS effector [Methylocella sp.]|nr:LirA/MavJ family T4SS effector [Methylocella sp.]